MFIWFAIYIVSSFIFFYDIYRISKIFNFNMPYYVIIWISLLFWFLSFFTIWYQWENKLLTILWTFSSWIFVFAFLLLWLLLLEHFISIWYKINQWIVLWFVCVIMSIWFFFAFYTKITNLDIETDKIDKDMKILLVSDVHVDYVMNTVHINKIINYIKKEKPDLVLIAWDLLNRPHSWYLKYYEVFNDKEITTPIYAIVWNHDVVWNSAVIQELSNISSIRLLKHETIEDKWIKIIGIFDKSMRRNFTLEEAMEETDFDNEDSKFTILMTHQPISLEKLDNYNIDLEVAGHTHRGQILWFRQLVYFMNDYWYWRYDHDWKIAFVTQWIWTWWLPFRFWTQSEMVSINLKKK